MNVLKVIMETTLANIVKYGADNCALCYNGTCVDGADDDDDDNDDDDNDDNNY